MIRFESSYFFLTLAVLPSVIYYRKHKQTHPVMGIPDLSSVRGIKRSIFLKVKWVLPALKYTVLCLVIAAIRYWAGGDVDDEAATPDAAEPGGVDSSENGPDK